MRWYGGGSAGSRQVDEEMPPTGFAAHRLSALCSGLFRKANNLRRNTVGGCCVIGERSVSRVLSGYFRNPDDHFSTNMVTHAL